MKTIKSILYSTIHRNKKPIGVIAEEMGVSESSLYRYPLEGESGSEMPLSRLVPLMKTTKDYELLKHIARLCGFVVVNIPRFKASRGDDSDIISNYQEVTSAAGGDLIKFLQHPDPKSYEHVTESLHKVLETAVSSQKYCDKKVEGQMEMEL